LAGGMKKFVMAFFLGTTSLVAFPSSAEAGPAAAIISAAATSFGPGATAFTALSGFWGTNVGAFVIRSAIGLALNALAPRPSLDKPRGYEFTAKDSILDHQIIYGRTKVGGALVHQEITDGGNFLHRVVAFAGHEIESFDAIYLNEEELDIQEIAIYELTVYADTGNGLFSRGTQRVIARTSDVEVFVGDQLNLSQYNNLINNAQFVNQTLDLTGFQYAEVDDKETKDNTVASGTYLNKVRINRHLGNENQLADSDLVSESSVWTDDHRLRGVAYLYIRLEAEDGLWPSGVPEFTAIVKGKKVYDPRVDDTYWSDNPALCIRDYIKEGYGLGEDFAQIDGDMIASAANTCEELVSGEQRYTCNGAFVTSQTPYDVLNNLLSSCGGGLWYAQGKWRLKVAEWTAPVLDLDEDDLRGSISVSTKHSRRDNYNKVNGTFKGSASNWQITDFEPVTNQDWLDQDGGFESTIDLDLPFTDTEEEARRIALIALEVNRQQLTVQAPFGMKALQVQVGDNIRLTNSRFGWTNKTFEVVQWSFGIAGEYDLAINLTLRETEQHIFDEVNDGDV